MEYTPEFETWWNEYPNKKGKLGAFEKWNQLKRKGVLPEVINLLAAVRNQKGEKIHLKKINQFCPEWKHPKTWLHNGCWEDVCILPQQSKPKPMQQSTGIGNLQRALNILKNLGIDKFNEFCNGIKMPKEDRDRVLDSYKHPDLIKRATRLAAGAVKGG